MKRAKLSGVYVIKNLVNNKVLVGYTGDLYGREKHHFRDLKRNKHKNEHLQNAYNKYGIENFVFETLEEYDTEFLPSMENWWANMLNAHNKRYGYNILPTSPKNGKKLSLETRLKMSKSQKERGNKGRHVYTKEDLEKMSIERKGRIPWNKGKKLTPEHIENMFKNNPRNSGKKSSDQKKAKLSEANKGRIVTKEVREKMSKARLGKKNSEQTKQKIGDFHRGKKKNPESIKKRTETRKKNKELNKVIL